MDAPHGPDPDPIPDPGIGPGPDSGPRQIPEGSPAATGAESRPTGPAGFGDFWRRTLAADVGRGDPSFVTVESSLRSIVVEDVTFAGFGGHPVKGWMLTPATGCPRGTVIQFLGNNTGRGLPEQWTLLPSAGYATFVMDNRGQTGPASVGDTPDPVGSGPQIIGRMTSGIAHPEEYYYRRLFTDAVRAVRAVRHHAAAGTATGTGTGTGTAADSAMGTASGSTVGPAPSAHRIFVAGGSQGGATALAVAGLCDDLAGVLVDVPLLCDIRSAVETATAGPYLEILDLLRTRRGNEDAVFEVLSFFDGKHFASRARIPALFSVGLLDPVCPAGSVQAAFAAYAGAEKTLCTYPYDGHEHGQWQHKRRHLEFLDHHTAGGTT